jgi:protein TonB
LLAIFVAAVVHAILFYVEFEPPHANKPARSIDITLSHSPLKNAPKQAKFLAADHQLGAGNKRHQPEAPQESVPVLTQMPAQAATSDAKPKQQAAQEIKNPTPQKLLTQPKAPIKIAVPEETVDEEPTEAVAEEKPHLSAEALQQQIAQLGEQIRNSQQSSEDSKIKFVNSVSTHKSLAAQYETDWTNKIERTGNLNYPAAARKAGSSQALTMDVGINADGSIYSMRITRSSGNPALDEAAKRIVKMSAPFAELPTNLLKEVNVLVITRVWKFSDETGMMTAH